VSGRRYLILEPRFVVSSHPDGNVRITNESGTVTLSTAEAIRAARVMSWYLEPDEEPEGS
jgi:hypothetical protein